MSTGQRIPPSPHAQAGFSVLEVLCGMTLMFVGLLALASSTVTGIATKETNRESASATYAARRFLEGMQTGEVPCEDLFRGHTGEPTTEDGRFAGKSGDLLPVLEREFAVKGLDPVRGRTAASIGAVSFPVADGEEGPELREDIAGRDLNGDGLIDSENHADDYKILPVTVRVEWQGTRGVRQIEVQSLLIRR